MILSVLVAAVGQSLDLPSPVGHSSMISRDSGGFLVTFQPSEWPNVSFTPARAWDWSAASALTVSLTNQSSGAISVGFRMDDDSSADGWNHTRSAQIALGAHQTKHVAIAFGPDPMTLGMRALPPISGYDTAGVSGNDGFDLSHVVTMQFFMHQPSTDVPMRISDVRLLSAKDRDLKGIVDRFGQFSAADWPGKIHSLRELDAEKAKEAADLKSRPQAPDRDRFGGWSKGPALKSTGYFRTEKVTGKWWLVDPDGRLFFSFGIDTVQPEETTFVTGRESMFQKLPKKDEPLGAFWGHTNYVHAGPVHEGDTFNFYGANLFQKFGPHYLEDWRRETLDRFLSWGFNTIGNWSDGAFHGNKRVPYVATLGIGGSHARLSSGSDYWSTMHDPFDPQFAKDVDESVSQADYFRGDPYCVGYFVDNELSWSGAGDDARYGLALGALSAKPDSPGKKELIRELRAEYGEVGKLNSAWETQFSDWSAMDSVVKLRLPLNAAQRSDASRFVHALALKYFTVVRNALKVRDPDHLYLGCRFAWFGPEAEQAAAEVCDVVSYNVYAPELDPKEWEHAVKLNKPCIIGEFHFGALDRGMFHPGLVATPDQQARAAMYQSYVRSVLSNPAFVGCHWFQYTDEPLTGRFFDGENYNIGFVTVTDSPYPEMVNAARKVQYDGYRIRWDSKSK